MIYTDSTEDLRKMRLERFDAIYDSMWMHIGRVHDGKFTGERLGSKQNGVRKTQKYAVMFGAGIKTKWRACVPALQIILESGTEPNILNKKII